MSTSNFTDDFIQKISNLNKKEIIKEVIDGQFINTNFERMRIYICDGKEDCMNVLGIECKSCDFCNKHFCYDCVQKLKIEFVFCESCQQQSCQLENCPVLFVKNPGVCERCN